MGLGESGVVGLTTRNYNLRIFFSLLSNDFFLLSVFLFYYLVNWSNDMSKGGKKQGPLLQFHVYECPHCHVEDTKRDLE